jgi:hypothetical protein
LLTLSPRLGIVRARQEARAMYSNLPAISTDAMCLTGAWLVASRGGFEAED